jgi:2',3'-cyclic-nucleotide 2'-phosphodiesterase (5'-nucleotidase family)
MTSRPFLFVLNIFLYFTFTNGFLSPETSFLKRRDNMPIQGAKAGGRAPGSEDKITSSEEWQPTPCAPGEARLTIIQITDTYTLDNLASVKTLLADTREKSKGSKVISMMTGDFLAPYLLSSVDRGKGMMNALSKIPIDYLTW